MPNEIDDKVAGAKTALAKANAKFPSPKPAAVVAPVAAQAKPAAKPMLSAGEDAAAGIRSKQANVAAYEAALPKMHKGGIVSAPEGRSSEYRKVYVARRQSRQGGGNTPVKGEKHDTKKA